MLFRSPALLVEFEEPERLDPDRATGLPEAPPSPETRRATSPLGLAGSIGVHLLPLLVLLTWHGTPPDAAVPIPVQLVVLEEPKPPPPQPPPPEAKEAKPPSPGRLASVDIGEPAAKADQPADSPEPAAEPPKETTLAAALPRAKPMPPPELVSALPKPAPVPEPDIKLADPATPQPEKPPVSQAVAARPMPNLRPPPHSGQVPGPAASRDEYLAYCMSLVRRHYGLLPPSFLAGRRGITVLKIMVLSNGTIAGVETALHSGYRDIDSRVEQMIAAVHRFPPLPQWIQRSSITMTYELAFPEGLLER